MKNIDLKPLVIELLNDEEVNTQIAALTDDLFERYKAKALGALGGLQKGMNYAQEGAMPSIIDGKGRISLKGVLPILLQSFLGNKDANSPETPNSSQTAWFMKKQT